MYGFEKFLFFKGLLLFIKDNFFFAEDNSFDKSGIGYQIVINPLKNIHQIWKVDTTVIHGFLILPPHEKPDFEKVGKYNNYDDHKKC